MNCLRKSVEELNLRVIWQELSKIRIKEFNLAKTEINQVNLYHLGNLVFCPQLSLTRSDMPILGYDNPSQILDLTLFSY